MEKSNPTRAIPISEFWMKVSIRETHGKKARAKEKEKDMVISSRSTPTRPLPESQWDKRVKYDQLSVISLRVV